MHVFYVCLVNTNANGNVQIDDGFIWSSHVHTSLAYLNMIILPIEYVIRRSQFKIAFIHHKSTNRACVDQ